MEEKFVVSYLDLEEDKVKVVYFTSVEEANKELKEITSNKRYMSEMLMTESEWEEFELEQAIEDEVYED